MKDRRKDRVHCAEIRYFLRENWAAGASAVHLAEEEPTAAYDTAACKSIIEAHLASCGSCRGEAQMLQDLDSSLRSGLAALGERTSPLTRERISETIRRTREESSEAQLIRRIRRPLRILLWGIFYAFTLLASLALAVAVYKAIQGHL